MTGAGRLAFWPLLIGGAVVAAFGDCISCWIGYVVKDRVHHMPLSKHPEMFARDEAFFHGWGAGARASSSAVSSGRCAPPCR